MGLRLPVQIRASEMKVTRLYAGKRAFFEVGDQKHQVSVQANCDCSFMGKQGVANGEICSHILAVLYKVGRDGGLQTVNLPKEEMLQMRRNEALSLVRASNRKVNEVRFSSSEGKEHVAAKVMICEELVKMGKSFVTEAIFTTGGRADVFVLDDWVAVEIASSESEESIEEKRTSYPRGVKVEVVRTGGISK